MASKPNEPGDKLEMFRLDGETTMREFLSFVRRYFSELNFERHTGMVLLAWICGLCWVVPFDQAWPIVIALGLGSAYCLTSRQPTNDENDLADHDRK